MAIRIKAENYSTIENMKIRQLNFSNKKTQCLFFFSLTHTTTSAQ